MPNLLFYSTSFAFLCFDFNITRILQLFSIVLPNFIMPCLSCRYASSHAAMIRSYFSISYGLSGLRLRCAKDWWPSATVASQLTLIGRGALGPSGLWASPILFIIRHFVPPAFLRKGMIVPLRPGGPDWLAVIHLGFKVTIRQYFSTISSPLILVNNISLPLYPKLLHPSNLSESHPLFNFHILHSN